MVLSIALSNPRWLQEDFITLVGLFYRVGLNTNVGKTVRIFCYPCRAEGKHSEAAYRNRMKGAGPSYQERQWGWIQRKEYGEEMALGLLAGHM